MNVIEVIFTVIAAVIAAVVGAWIGIVAVEALERRRILKVYKEIDARQELRRKQTEPIETEKLRVRLGYRL